MDPFTKQYRLVKMYLCKQEIKSWRKISQKTDIKKSDHLMTFLCQADLKMCLDRDLLYKSALKRLMIHDIHVLSTSV